VKISWKKPGGNGADINKFRVYIKHKDGLFKLESTYCNENDSYVF
jgi:hypothetical protein